MVTKADEVNNRTHEPSLRELTADLDGLESLLMARLESLTTVMDERDRRYEDRFKAMDDKTGLALTSSEKAVAKAETATEKRFDSVNEFRNTLKDQASTLMPRGEVEAKYKAFDGQLDELKREMANLREFRSQGVGEKEAIASVQTQRNWGIGILVAIFFGGISIIISAVGLIVGLRK